MTSKNKFYLFGLGIIIIFLVILGAAKNLYWPSQKVINNDQSDVITSPVKTATSTEEVYNNKKGNKWTLDDNADFSVSNSKDVKVKFLEGQIIPLKVHPGDTQNMRVVVVGDNEINSVSAEIETDHGTTTVELKKTGVVVVKDLNLNLAKYIVNAKNELQILSSAETLVYRQKEITAEPSSNVINSAMAAGGEREIWEGSWVVKDTSVQTYHTIFIATDSQGNKNQLVLAWSDPCIGWPVSIPAGTTYTTTSNSSCSIGSSQLYGIDGGSLALAPGSSVIINSGASLIFNSGQHITMSGGSISMSNTSASIQKAYIYYVDQDKDGYAADGGGGLPTVIASSNSGDASYYAYLNGSTWARRGMKSGAPDPYVSVDCNDGDAAKFITYPGTFYTDIDGDGYRPAYPTTVSNICAGASMPTGWTTNTTGTDCLDSDVNFKPSQVNWWTSSATNSGDYNCNSVTELAWANNNTAGVHTPAQTTDAYSQGMGAREILCSSYSGTQYLTTYCGQALTYTGSLFYISDNAGATTCDLARSYGKLVYWGAGPRISVCR